MDLIKLEKIRALAAKFRDAIEKCERKKLPITLKNFPTGSGGDTVPFLGTYLKENGLGDFE